MGLTIDAVMTHAIKMAFESIQVSGPEAPKLSQPGVNLLKWFRVQPVKTALRIDGGFDKAGIAQHAQVLGHGGLRHAKLAFDLSHRLLGRGQEA